MIKIIDFQHNEEMHIKILFVDHKSKGKRSGIYSLSW